MTKITQSGAAERLAKLTHDIDSDLAQSLEQMSPEELGEFLDQEWNDAPDKEKQRLLWIAQKMQRKILTLVEESRKEEREAAMAGRELAAGTDVAISTVHGKPFHPFHLAGHELFFAVALEAPREVVLGGMRWAAAGRRPDWTHLVVGKKRYRLKSTRDPNVWRCKGLTRDALQDALTSDPKLEISVL